MLNIRPAKGALVKTTAGNHFRVIRTTLRHHYWPSSRLEAVPLPLDNVFGLKVAQPQGIRELVWRQLTLVDESKLKLVVDKSQLPPATDWRDR